MSAVTVSNEREIQPMMLSLEQLSKLKQQHEEELQELQKQLEALHGAKYRFINARTTIDDISQSRTGEEILIPLSSSLYVPGKIRSPGKVIVELGTGYFCEKNIPEAKDLIDRKIQLVQKSMESIENVGLNKKKALEQIVLVMNYKISLAQQSNESKA